MMEWTNDFTNEMRERHLRQIKLYAIFLGVTLPVLLVTYFFFFTRGSFLTNYFYFYLGYLALALGSLGVFWALLRKAAWTRATSWVILVWDAANLTAITYVHGAPHFHMMMLYLVAIMLYSIYLHPTLATRLFVMVTALLGLVSVLIVYEVVPFGPMLLNPDYTYPAVITEHVNSGFMKFLTLFGYVMAAFFAYGTLRLINSIVDEMRAREQELVISNEKISILSEKLRAYLPHQFVDSLASGQRDPRPDYKRKRLTVFFSDVQGFTPWTDKLEPEETKTLLNQYLSEMSAITSEWGGTLVQFVGDAIMIFFGDPEFTNDKDHALRCLKMAMAMQAKMAELRVDWEDRGFEEPLHIRIGVNTGYATVGAFGSTERLNYTALGSTVNMAARLEGVCAPDQITISHATYALIKDEIECQPLGEVTVKGFADPVTIHEVVGVKVKES